jgi:DNA-directed RNA polymerase specialized sigma24 family protein
MGDPEDDDPEDDDGRPHPDDVDEAGDESPRATAQDVEAFVKLPATRKRIAGIVGESIPSPRVKDVVHDVCVRALASKWLPREAKLKSWLDSVTRREIADQTRKRVRRAKYEGATPVAPAVLDEAGLPIEDPGDAVVDIDASTDPTRENPVHEGMLMRRWMSGAVAGDETARVTFEILEEWADATEDEDDDAKKKATLRRLAKKRGLSEDAFYKRYERLKETYLPRYKRWRNGMIILFLFGATLLVVVLSKCCRTGRSRRRTLRRNRRRTPSRPCRACR